ncbi:hypothetical protein ACHZ98_23435 [Streptomyces sp. MAR4 CNY-716]
MELTGHPTDFLADLGYPEAVRKFLVHRTREFFVVTLLTPDDPATDPFSGTVLNDLRASFAS